MNYYCAINVDCKVDLFPVWTQLCPMLLASTSSSALNAEWSLLNYVKFRQCFSQVTLFKGESLFLSSQRTGQTRDPKKSQSLSPKHVYAHAPARSPLLVWYLHVALTGTDVVHRKYTWLGCARCAILYVGPSCTCVCKYVPSLLSSGIALQNDKGIRLSKRRRRRGRRRSEGPMKYAWPWSSAWSGSVSKKRRGA